mmetsp:Transcript_13078/g.30539  ORF Transcript_13078/g.30539 Transcript_13078/m.30539 type:complete len:200 (+) Transcript_13078:282-881(+)
MHLVVSVAESHISRVHHLPKNLSWKAKPRDTCASFDCIPWNYIQLSSSSAAVTLGVGALRAAAPFFVCPEFLWLLPQSSSRSYSPYRCCCGTFFLCPIVYRIHRRWRSPVWSGIMRSRLSLRAAVAVLSPDRTYTSVPLGHLSRTKCRRPSQLSAMSSVNRTPHGGLVATTNSSFGLASLSLSLSLSSSPPPRTAPSRS